MKSRISSLTETIGLRSPHSFGAGICGGAAAAPAGVAGVAVDGCEQPNVSALAAKIVETTMRAWTVRCDTRGVYFAPPTTSTGRDGVQLRPAFRLRRPDGSLR